MIGTLETSQVRIFKSKDFQPGKINCTDDLPIKISGAGFLVSKGCIMTCAHVVGVALGDINIGKKDNPPDPSQKIIVDFPLAKNGTNLGPFYCSVIGDSWRKAIDENQWDTHNNNIFDIAVLKIESTVLDGDKHEFEECQKLPALKGFSQDYIDEPFKCFGHPCDTTNKDVLQANGTYRYGKFSGKTANGNIEVQRRTSDTQFIERGFSGTSAFIKGKLDQGSVGMIVSLHDKGSKSLVIPASVLQSVWPEFSEYTSEINEAKGITVPKRLSMLNRQQHCQKIKDLIRNVEHEIKINTLDEKVVNHQPIFYFLECQNNDHHPAFLDALTIKTLPNELPQYDFVSKSLLLRLDEVYESSDQEIIEKLKKLIVENLDSTQVNYSEKDVVDIINSNEKCLLFNCDFIVENFSSENENVIILLIDLLQRVAKLGLNQHVILVFSFQHEDPNNVDTGIFRKLTAMFKSNSFPIFQLFMEKCQDKSLPCASGFPAYLECGGPLEKIKQSHVKVWIDEYMTATEDGPIVNEIILWLHKQPAEFRFSELYSAITNNFKTN